MARMEACCLAVLLLAAGGVLIVGFAVVIPVLVTVDEATLGRLSLAAPGNNGTAAAPSLSYDLALVVTVHNHNWLMHVRSTAPLVAELRFAGQAFHRGRLELEVILSRTYLHRVAKVSYRIRAAADAVALGSSGAAELAREEAAGLFELDLVVAGQFKYQAHFHRRGLRVSCPLTLALSTATHRAPFDSVACT